MSLREALTRDDWLRAAMELLRGRGVGGVRVLELARLLNVTRGSFYWHFSNRQDLLDHMPDWWDREATDSVIRHVESAKGDGHKRILTLGDFVLRGNLTRYDMAMRSWSETDRKVARVVRKVMQKRLAYVADLFHEAGFARAESRVRGHLLAVYLMNEGTVLIGESLQSRLRLFRRQVRALMRRE